MTEVDYLNRGLAVLTNLQESGGNLSPRLERHFCAAVNHNVPRVHISHDPVSHLILELSKNGWPELIQERVEMANRIGYWLELMLFQLENYTSRPRQQRMQVYDQISLASRRHLLFCAGDYRYADPDCRSKFFNNIDQLPRPSLRSTTPEFIPASRLLIDEFRLWEQRIECRLAPNRDVNQPNEMDSIHEDEPPLAPVRLSEDEVANVGRFRGSLSTGTGTLGGRQAQAFGLDASLTRMQAPACLIEPAAYTFLQEISALEAKGGFAALTTEELLFSLFWLIEIYHGIPFFDAAQLGLINMTRFGRVTENELIINLASGYYPAACDAWESKLLPLPLARECCAVLPELRRRNPQAQTLREFRRINLRDEHRREVRNYLGRVMPGFKGAVVHVFRIFEKVGKIELDLPSSEIGLLKGKPLPGARGEAAYISETHEFLVNRLEQIQNKIRENAGIPGCVRPFPVTGEIYGTTALSFTEFWAKSRNHVAASKEINEVLACLVRFTRGLGFRNYKDHFNPWRWFREEPLPCLEFRDKVVAGWQAPRYVWISPAIQILIQACGDLFGDMEHLPYIWQSRVVRFAFLPDSEQQRLQSILRDDRQHNSGRTALYNALRKGHMGEVLRQVIIGHGPMSSHLFGCHMPVSPKQLLEMTAEFLDPLFEREGVNEVALALAEKMKQYISADAIQSATTAKPDQKEAAIRFKAPRSVHAPPSFHEWTIYRRVKTNLNRLHYGCVNPVGGMKTVRRKSIDSFPTNELGLLGIMALELGLPLKHLLNFHKYYTWDSFVLEKNSGIIYFLAVGRHGDVGGLFRYPIFVCLAREAQAKRLMRLVRYALARALRRQRKRTKIKHRHQESVLRQSIFADAAFTQKMIGKGLKFLLAKQGQRNLLTETEAFAQLSRVTETSCALRHPGLVAAVFSGRSPIGLNYFNLADLLSPGSGREAVLETLLHTKFEDRLALNFEELEKTDPKIAAPITDPGSATAWFDFLKKSGQPPSQRSFFDVINRVLVNPARSAVLATHVMKKFAADGRLRTSRPLPLIEVGTWDLIMARTDDFIALEARPQLGGRNARLDGVTKELLIADHRFFFRWVENTISRPQEIDDLNWPNVFDLNGRIFIHCSQGKTSAARRTIDVGLFSPSRAGYRELTQWLLQRHSDQQTSSRVFGALSRHYQGSNAHTKNLSRYLSRAIERTDLTAYDLRHNGVIEVLRIALNDRLRHGNLHSWLCLLSISIGHQALSVTLNTYVGTAAHTFTGNQDFIPNESNPRTLSREYDNRADDRLM